MSTRGFSPTISGSLSVSTSSNPTALGGAGDICIVQNLGTVAAYVVVGVGAANTVATNTKFPLQPGGSVQLDAQDCTYIDAITASSTTTLVFSVGSGVPNLDTATSADLVVPGSISVTQGTSPWVVDATVNDTPVSPATATATKGSLVGIQYNSTQATFTNGQQGALQATARGAAMVAVGADGFAVTSRPTANTTGTQSIVASSGSDVTILASNAARLGATVFNDSTQILYLLLSNATSSATVYTLQMAANGYYEVPFGYSGVIKGIWASANGNARVTEITA